MSTQFIRVNDRVITKDGGHSGLRGEVIFGRGRHDVHFIDPYGNPAVRSEFDEILYTAENIVPIGGYQFAFDKLFNIGLDQESTLRVGDLNDEAPQMKIGVSRGKYKSIYYNAEAAHEINSVVNQDELQPRLGVNIPALNYIFGFMVGDGGCREDNITPIAPDYKNRNLYHAIPFRMSNDQLPFPNGKYFGQMSTFKGDGSAESIKSYYVKKFDDPKPRIVHCWVTNSDGELEIVDDTVFASTSSMAIESYVEMNLSVSANDCRGYFTTSNTTPRVNEFALVSGWFNPLENDYESLRMFTHFTRPNITLAEGDSIEAIYRMHAR